MRLAQHERSFQKLFNGHIVFLFLIKLSKVFEIIKKCVFFFERLSNTNRDAQSHLKRQNKRGSRKRNEILEEGHLGDQRLTEVEKMNRDKTEAKEAERNGERRKKRRKKGGARGC